MRTKAVPNNIRNQIKREYRETRITRKELGEKYDISLSCVNHILAENQPPSTYIHQTRQINQPQQRENNAIRQNTDLGAEIVDLNSVDFMTEHNNFIRNSIQSLLNEEQHD